MKDDELVMKDDELVKNILGLLERPEPYWSTLDLARKLSRSPYSIWKIVTELHEKGIIEIIPLSSSGKISSHSFLRLKST